MQAAGNPYPQTETASTLADFITANNLSWSTYEGYVNQLNAVPPTMTQEQYDAAVADYIFALTPSGTKASQEDVDRSFNNLKDKIKQVPGGTSVYAGMLVAPVVDAAVLNPNGPKPTSPAPTEPNPPAPTKYTVTFDRGNQAAAVVPDPAEVDEGTTLQTLAESYIPTCDGFSFRGWSVDNDNAADQMSTVTSNITVYACWLANNKTVTVTLNANGGTFGALAAEWTVNGEQATRTYTGAASYEISSDLIAVTITKANCDFDGWGVNTGAAINLTADASYTAQWSDTTYAVTFGANAPEGKTVLGMPSNTELAYNTPINLAAYTPTCDGGYLLSGWKVNGQDYAKNGTLNMPANAITIQAQWSLPSFNIAYYNGTDVTAIETVTVNMTGTATTLKAAITKTGADFAGWLINSTTYDGSASFTYTGITAGATIDAVAQWTPKQYTVTFVDGYNTPGTIDTQTVNYGNDATAPADPTRANYQFNGWDKAYTNITEDTTVTATWTENPKYTLKYNGNGNGTNQNPVTHATTSDYNGGTYYANETVVMRDIAGMFATVPNSTWTFLGWNTQADGNGTTYAVGTNFTMGSAAVTLYAKWEVPAASNITVTVNFVDTWNVETTTVTGVSVPATGTVVAADVAASAPTYWVSSDAQVTGVTDGATITFNGTRHNTQVVGDVGTDYIVVTKPLGLTKIGDPLTNLTGNYWLLNNIDASTLTKPLGWGDEIGAMDPMVEFTGKFDGNGMTISNLNMVKSSTSDADNRNCVGLFAYNCGTIRNITLAVTRLSGNLWVGAAAGANDGGTIDKITVTLPNYGIYSLYGMAGGVVGYSFNEGTINDCHVFSTESQVLKNIYGGTISKNGCCMSWHFDDDTNTERYFSGIFLGGIVGLLEHSSTNLCSVGGTNKIGIATDTYYTGNSGGSSKNYGYFIGGIAGYNWFGTIDKCWSYGALINNHVTTKTGSELGGLRQCGGICGFNYGTVSNCWSRGTKFKSLYSNAGGLLGTNWGTLTTSWTYFAGYTYANQSASVKDDVGTLDGDIINVAVWDAYYGISTGSTNYSSGLADMLPTGFGSTVWVASASGPMLNANPYVETPQ